MEIEAFRMPRYREIPAIGLYLEQAARYVNTFLSPLGIQELTPSMISNYVKHGYIANPVRKQYGADQLASLMMIAVAKNVVSMDNVQTLKQLQPESLTLAEIYDDFCSQMEAELRAAFGCAGEAVPAAREDEGWQLMHSVIVAAAHVIRLINRFEEARDSGEAS